jgi:predicted ferric reductase
MILMVSTGITFFVYRSILSRFLVKKTKYIVDNISYLNNKTVEIAMLPLLEGICFRPGQFIFISFYDKDIGLESHPFSISSSCEDNKLRLTIKSLGDFTAKLKSLEIGTVAEVEGPFGRFYESNSNKDQVWIAGGVGITPFLSMAKSINGSSEKIDLLYVSKNPSESVCLDNLCEISQEKENFKVLPYYTEMQGRLNAETIERLTGDLKDKIIYLCGPSLMMKSLKYQFAKLNVPKENIRLEEFAFL